MSEKYRRNVLMGLGLVIMGLVNGCGDITEETGADAALLDSAVRLTGTDWTTGCVKAFEDDDWPVSISIGFSQGTLAFVSEVPCRSMPKTFRFRMEMLEDYDVSWFDDELDGHGGVISSSVQQVHVTLVDDYSVRMARANSLAGFSDWVVGVPKEVTGAESFPAEAQEFQRAFKIIDGTLELAYSDGTNIALLPRRD